MINEANKSATKLENTDQRELLHVKHQLSNAYEVIKELLSDNNQLKEKLKLYEGDEQYNPAWSWISKIVFIISQADKPLRSSEIISQLQLKEPILNKKNSKEQFVSAFLTQALRYRRLIPYRLKGVRGNYYCLPQWIRDGQLDQNLLSKIY